MSARTNGKNGHARPRKRLKQSTAQKGDPPKPVGELIVPDHGRGKIWRGPCANPVAGPGRPRSAIRDRLSTSFDQRIPFLESVVDGVVPLVGRCTKCGHLQHGAPIAPPTYDDRIRSMDVMGKYGMGPHTGIPVDEIRRRVAATIDKINEVLSPEYATPLIHAIRPIWSRGAA